MSYPTYLFLSEIPADVMTITGKLYHYLIHVRRLRVGAPLRLALPDGTVADAEIIDITALACQARVTARGAVTGDSPCRITLFQALLKGEKMEWVVQKAGELGATMLVPLLAARCVPRVAPQQWPGRLERWQRIADASAAQSERSQPLIVSPPCNLEEAARAYHGVGLVLSERGGHALREVATDHPGATAITLYLGPEGGWQDDELATLRDAGIIPVHLGTRILRAETAALAAVTLAQYLWGDLGG